MLAKPIDVFSFLKCMKCNSDLVILIVKLTNFILFEIPLKKVGDFHFFCFVYMLTKYNIEIGYSYHQINEQCFYMSV